MSRFLRLTSLGVFLTLILGACAALQTARPRPAALKIDYEKYTLDNGLEVILHEDKSDPIVSVCIMFHVGSGREKPRRTGFAHLFEHILFEGSEHVPQGLFDRNIATAGGTLNGGTSKDYTVYYEVVPKNALEMVLWMESDRFGYTMSALTEEAFLQEKDAVLNERRFRYDNVPYGLTSEVISLNLYPEDHPYHWSVIGFPEDIQQATLDDAREFFLRWYGPNNATLVIAGDFNSDHTKALIEKFFGPLPSGPATADPEPSYPPLSSMRRIVVEDNFAKSPELNMVFPTIEGGHPDMYPLDLLSSLLSDGKKAPLYKVIVEEEKLAPSASIGHSNQEIAGTFTARVRAFPGISLSDVEQAIFKAFERFEQEGFADQDLERVKIGIETSTYYGIASVYSKSYQMAFANELYGSPEAIMQEIEHYRSVTREDIMRVYRTYVKDKPFVLTSFVPKDRAKLAASESKPHEHSPGPKALRADLKQLSMRETPITFDRSAQPPLGPDPELTLPDIWRDTLHSGVEVYGIEHHELPLVAFSLTMKGGHALDTPGKYGAANLLSDLMMEGTRSKTPIELEEAIDNLGASISVSAGRESFSISASCLASKFEESFALVQEILLEPRWDEKEFERLKRQTLEIINRNSADPNMIAWNTFNRLVYNEGNPQAVPVYGDEQSVNSLSIDDLKSFYNENLSPSAAHLTIAGAVTHDRVMQAFSNLPGWNENTVQIPQQPEVQRPEKATLYFVDVPGASQSEIRIGYLGLPYTHPDNYPANVMNYRLGARPDSYLETIIRQEKGYTYVARSAFVSRHNPGPFVAYSNVRADATYDALVTFREIFTDYGNGIPEEDLTYTKRAMLRSNARRFETLGALQGVLTQIATYNLLDDYIKQQEAIIRDMTLDQHRALAQKYIKPDKMIYLVVGDAATQLEPLKQLGLGDPILLEVD